jgi:hypothetical protein
MGVVGDAPGFGGAGGRDLIAGPRRAGGRSCRQSVPEAAPHGGPRARSPDRGASL